MDQETKDRIVELALAARDYLEQGKFDGYTETLNKLWAEVDWSRGPGAVADPHDHCEWGEVCRS